MNNREIDISIIIPVYNAAKWLNSCLESVKKQTYKNYELILINDGSTDESAQICKNYALKDERVVYIEQENRGVSYTRNLGIQIAKGKYVTLLDNDDYLNIDFLKIIKNNIAKEPDVLIFKYKDVSSQREIENNVVVENNTCVQTILLEGKSEYLQKEMLCPRDSNLKEYAIVFPWAKVYKKDFLMENNLQFDARIKLCEDVYLNLELYDKANKILLVDYVAYFYYRNLESAGKGFNPRVIEMEKNNIKLLDRYVDSKHRSCDFYFAYSNCLCFRYWSCCFAYFIHPQNKLSIKQIIAEMKQFEKDSGVRRAFGQLIKLRNSMEAKEWLFFMAIKYHLYFPIVYFARLKMRKSRGL